MTATTGAVVSARAVGEIVDDFNRIVPTGNLPSGWGFNPAFGLWEEASSYRGDNHGNLANSVEHVDGSVAIFDVKYGYSSDPGGSYWFASGIYGSPTAVIAGPSSANRTDEWIKPPIDITFDLRLDVLGDLSQYAGGFAYWSATFGIGSESAYNMAENLGFTPLIVAGGNLDYAYPFAAFLQMYVNGTATTITMYPWTYFDGQESDQQVTMPFADFIGRWWSFHMQVTYAGVWVKFWLRGTEEPADWMAWEYGSTEATTSFSDGHGGFSSPDNYNVVGWQVISGASYPEIPLASHALFSTNGHGFVRYWGSYNPGGLPTDYVVALGDPGGGSGNFATPGYTLEIDWPVFSPGPPISASSSEFVASIWDGGVTHNPLWLTAPLISLRVQGQVRVAVSFITPLFEGPPTVSGTVTVEIQQFFYDLGSPSWSTPSPYPMDDPGDPHLLGGTTIHSLSVPYATGATTWVDFDFTVSTFTANNQFQWGFHIPDCWAELVSWGKFAYHATMATAVRNVVLTPTWDNLFVPPPELAGRLSMDNLRVAAGAQLTAIYGVAG